MVKWGDSLNPWGMMAVRLASVTKKSARIAAAEACLFLLLALVDPFQIVRWSEQRSRELWQEVYAPRYGADQSRTRQKSGTKDAREEIVIVYTDDTTLSRIGQSRPISGFQLIDMIDDVLLASGGKAAPKAIFVDFVLAHAAPRDRTADAMVAAIAAEREGCEARVREGPPLSPFQCLLARVSEITRHETWRGDPTCLESSVATISCIRKAGGTPLLFADTRQAGDAPSAALDALDRVAVIAPVILDERRYALADPDQWKARKHRAYRLYPAAALFAIHCADKAANCAVNPVEADDQDRPAWSKAFDREVDVIWATGGPSAASGQVERQRGGALEQTCEPADPSTKRALAAMGRLLFAGVDVSAPRPCLHSQAIPYDIFHSPISQAEIAKLVGGKLVLIGGQFADSNDVVAAPPYGSLPGIYYHAMALDNLISYGADYPKAPRRVFASLNITWTDMGNAAAIFAVGFFLAAARNVLAARERRSWASRAAWLRDLGTRALIGFGFLGVMLALFILFVAPLRLVPPSFNLVAITLLCFAGAAQLLWLVIQPVRVAAYRQFTSVRFPTRPLGPPSGAARGQSRTRRK